MGYAVRAWASCDEVTARMRKLLRLRNRQARTELVPEGTIKKLGSKSCRVGMATTGRREGVPMPEIVERGECTRELRAALRGP